MTTIEQDSKKKLNSELGEQSDSMNNHGEIVSFIWSVADLIRDTFKRGKY